MPLHLDENDIAIIKSLLNDGRKSFRQISRETGITTPTVKARFERLVNVGFLKGVIPIFDFGKVDNSDGPQQKQEVGDRLIQIQSKIENSERIGNANGKTNDVPFEKEISEIENKITDGLAISMVCDFCEGPIFGKPKILKYANIERFFCCTSCKSNYFEKYKGRIESIKRNYEGKSELDDRYPPFL